MDPDHPRPATWHFTATGGELPPAGGTVSGTTDPALLIAMYEDLTYTHVVVTDPEGNIVAESDPITP